MLKHLKRFAAHNLSLNTRMLMRRCIPAPLRRWYHGHELADAYLVSYPKCGRTWLRIMIGRAIKNQFQLDASVSELDVARLYRHHPRIPYIRVYHDDKPHLKPASELQRDKSRFRHVKVLFLVRDPRDALVSLYHHVQYREDVKGLNPETISQFVRDKLPSLIDYYNIWENQRDVVSSLCLIRYEDLHNDAERELRRVLDFLGLPRFDDAAIREAVQYASFDNMRKMEAQGRFNDRAMKVKNVANEEGFKTRQGKVGKYVDKLSPGDVTFCDKLLAERLNPAFGYPGKTADSTCDSSEDRR